MFDGFEGCFMFCLTFYMYLLNGFQVLVLLKGLNWACFCWAQVRGLKAVEPSELELEVWKSELQRLGR